MIKSVQSLVKWPLTLTLLMAKRQIPTTLAILEAKKATAYSVCLSAYPCARLTSRADGISVQFVVGRFRFAARAKLQAAILQGNSVLATEVGL